jgi:hypothetical protein
VLSGRDCGNVEVQHLQHSSLCPAATGFLSVRYDGKKENNQ